MDKIFAFLILLAGVLVSYFAPSKYDYSYSIICGIVYVAVIIVYYLVRKKDNYFDFDSLFFFTLFFVTLYYPIFMYETDATRYVFFLFEFDYHVIPRSSSLSVLGVSSYIFGSLMFNSKKYCIETSVLKNSLVRENKTINTKKFYIVAIVFFVLYIITGGYAELVSMYSGGKVEEANPIAKYFFLFCPAFLYAGIILDFHNIKILSPGKFSFKKINTISYAVIGFIVVSLILTGSRTVPMQVILIIVGLYSLLYKPIKLIRFFSFIILGFGLMFAVVLLRGYQQDAKFSGADLAMDLIINNRNNFLAIEKVRNDGYSYGSTMLSPLVAPIPFFQNFLLNIGFNEEDISSAKVFTYMTYGEISKFYGIGSTILADIYIAFGNIGIVFFMSLLGYVINSNRVKASYSLIALTVYTIFISHAVYIARAEYFYFARYLIWTLLIVFFATKKIRFD